MLKRKQIALKIQDHIIQKILLNFKEVLQSDAFDAFLVHVWNDDMTAELRQDILGNLSPKNCVEIFKALESKVLPLDFQTFKSSASDYSSWAECIGQGGDL